MKTILLLLPLILLCNCLSCNSKKTEKQSQKVTEKIKDEFTEEIKKIRPDDDIVFMSEFSQKELLAIELAKLSIKKAESQEVIGFTQRLIREHLELNQDLLDHAKTRGVKLPDSLEMISQVTLIELKDLKGEEFDQKLIEKIIKSHKKDIKELEKYRDKTKDKGLIEWINNSLSYLKRHLAEAQSIQAKISKTE